MPRVDLSKLPHPSLISSALLFVPGFFFELLVAAGNPSYTNSIQSALPSPTGPGLYIRALVVLFLAFLFGGLAGAWVRTTNMCIQVAYVQIRRIRDWYIRRATTPKPGTNPQLSPTGRRSLLNRLIRRQMMERAGQDAAMNVWTVSAARLLKAKYGIEPPRGIDAQRDWLVWFAILGFPGLAELRGSSLLKTFHAIGWCGLAAIHFAPPLRSPLFIAGCVFLIVHGLYQEWIAVLRFCHPTFAVGTHIASVLQEIPNGREPSKLKEAEE